MVSHLNPPNRQSHVCNFGQLIYDIRHAGLTRLLGVKVEIYQQVPTLPMSSLRTSSLTSGEPLAPSGSFFLALRSPSPYGCLYLGLFYMSNRGLLNLKPNAHKILTRVKGRSSDKVSRSKLNSHFGPTQFFFLQAMSDVVSCALTYIFIFISLEYEFN